jgi:hypothetical protein
MLGDDTVAAPAPSVESEEGDAETPTAAAPGLAVLAGKTLNATVDALSAEDAAAPVVAGAESVVSSWGKKAKGVFGVFGGGKEEVPAEGTALARNKKAKAVAGTAGDNGPSSSTFFTPPPFTHIYSPQPPRCPGLVCLCVSVSVCVFVYLSF